jgi:hypothetical protein
MSTQGVPQPHAKPLMLLAVMLTSVTKTQCCWSKVSYACRISTCFL